MNQTTDIIETSFNKDFCSKLESRICREFENSKDTELKGFWCDGVLWKPLIENQLTKKHVNDKRQIVTKAWIGKTGQTEYQATICFGKMSLSKYAKGIDLTDCIPEEHSQEDWIEIDIVNKTLEIKLN